MKKIYPFLVLLTLSCACGDRPASEEITDSFNKVDSSLAAGSGRARTATDNLLDSLDARTKEQTGDQSEWKNKAGSAVQMATSLIQYIEGIKVQLQSYPPDALEPSRELLVANGKGMELFNRLEQFNYAINSLDEGYAALYRNDPTVRLDIPKNKTSWPEYYFKSVPVFAAVTLLTKLQNDISNEELRFVHYCLQQAKGNN